MNDEQPARPARAPWLTGDIPATVAYLQEAAADLNPRDEVDRRDTMRHYTISIIEAIQSDSTLSGSAKNRCTLAALEALRQAIGGTRS